MVGTRGWGEGERGLLFEGDTVSVSQAGKVLEMDSGNSSML